MSDLDKAIRADIAWHGQDKFGRTITAVLDLHKPHAPYPLLPDDFRCAGCSNHVVRVDYPCATVQAIADALGVSGEDRPTPAPRKPQPGDMVRVWVGGKEGVVVGELVLIAEDDDPAREYVRAHADGREWLVTPNGRRRRIEVLSEVVTPEVPS